MDRFAWLASIAAGTLYGVGLRLLTSTHRDTPGVALLGVMSVAFIFAGPFAIGYIAAGTSFRRSPPTSVSWPRAIFAPWLAIIAMSAVTALFNLEGSLCIVFFLPVGFLLSSLGGIAAKLVQKHLSRKLGSTALVVGLLPLLLSIPESRVPESNEVRTVTTQIVIHAGPNTVWQNIKSVPPIGPAELPWSWTRTIGFPRPIEATLSKEGVGGVRQASFAGGVVFAETIFEWQPPNEIAFTICPNTESIPPTTMDEHVKVGGRYFDVLTGRYQVLPEPDGSTLLKLTSQERLSTHFNTYAGFWTDAVMSDIQRSILAVIKKRCELERNTVAN